MELDWPDDPYEFLVLHKFRELVKGDPIRAALTGYVIPEEKRVEATSYYGYLRELPADDINRMVQDIIYPAQNADLKEAEKQEQLRFFHQPHVNADFTRWLAVDTWLPHQAVSLSFGKCPDQVNPESLSPYLETSEFVRRYFARLRVLQPQPGIRMSVSPKSFAQWAKDRGIDLPKELVELLPDSAAPEAKSQIKDSLGARERDSLLKLVLAMAHGGYGYQPDEGRSPVVSEIRSDLHKTGLSMDADTIRKYLKEAVSAHWQDVADQEI